MEKSPPIGCLDSTDGKDGKIVVLQEHFYRTVNPGVQPTAENQPVEVQSLHLQSFIPDRVLISGYSLILYLIGYMFRLYV